VPRIKFLTDHGITVHTQVVLCPEINDGASLDQTIDQLSELHRELAASQSYRRSD